MAGPGAAHGDLRSGSSGSRDATGPDRAGEFSWRRALRGIGLLLAVIAAGVIVVLRVPGLIALRDRFADARPALLVLAGLLELGSCLSYVIVVRAVFCRTMRWRPSLEIGFSELATNSVVSVGGAGGLALGAWALRQSGMDARRVARRTVAFFLLTSVANVAAVGIDGIGLATGVFHGTDHPLLGWIPAALAAAGVVLVLAVRHVAAFGARHLHGRPAALLSSVADGVDEAKALLREGNPMLYLGIAGYMLFDVGVLAAAFVSFGISLPAFGVLLMAYLLGQLGGLVPLPGGLGGVDAGLVGSLLLYGIGATAATAAVVVYRVLVLSIPVVIGVPALIAMQRQLAHHELLEETRSPS